MDPENPEDVLDLEDEFEEEGETPEEQQGADEGDDADEGDEDLLLNVEDEEGEPEPESGPMKRMREQLEAEKKRRKEAEAKIPKIEVGPKPDLWEDCEGDPDKFEAALDAWRQRKADAEAQAAEAAAPNTSIRTEYEADHAVFVQQRAELAKKRPDVDQAEVWFCNTFDSTQQSALLMSTRDKAGMIVKLYRDRDTADKLATIVNPIKLGIAFREQEDRYRKMQAPRRKAPDPEPRMRGGTPGGGIGKTEEDLAKKADKTRDSSALVKHRYEQKQAAKKRRY